MRLIDIKKYLLQNFKQYYFKGCLSFDKQPFLFISR